jgi:uncharacterized pyridoxal phosphate-containing UPF0001 family protein
MCAYMCLVYWGTSVTNNNYILDKVKSKLNLGILIAIKVRIKKKKKRFIVQKVCTTCSRISYKIVLLTNMNKYSHSDTSDTEVNINISVNKDSEKKNSGFSIFAFPSNIQTIVKIHKIMILCVVVCFWEI